MRILPSFPKHIKPNSPDFGLPSGVFCVNHDMQVYVKPVMKVTGEARLLATSRADYYHTVFTKSGSPVFADVTGSEYAAVDLFLGHDFLTTPLYHLHRSSDSSKITYEFEDDQDGPVMRFGSWDGINLPSSGGTATHAHLVTAHLDEPPDLNRYVGCVLPYSFYIVNIYTFEEDRDGKSRGIACATGNDRFGSNKCPWVISAPDLRNIAKDPANCFPANCIY